MEPVTNTSHLNSVINAVAHDPSFINGDFTDIVEFITETAADALDCERVSVWTYQASPTKHILCLDYWDSISRQHTAGDILDENQAYSYLNALDKDMVLAMDDVTTDSRCKELIQSYLPANGISSMLDAPYQYDGELAGVICCEHVGPQRTWTDDERHFCSNIASLLSIARERENRKAIAAQLEVEKNNLRTLMDQSPDGILIMIDDRIVYANAAMHQLSQLFGSEQIIGQTLEAYLDEEALATARARHQQALNSKQAMPVKEYRISKNGVVRIIEVTSAHVTWEEKDAVQAVIRDTTEQSKMREEIDRFARQFSTLLESYPGAFIYITPEQHIVQYNSTFINLLGVEEEANIPVAMESFSLINEDFKAAWPDVLNGKSRKFETVIEWQAGNPMLAEVSLVPDKEQDESVRGVFALIDDISERKYAEDTLRNAQKMEAIGQLTGGIAHDFNNLLTVIMGNLELVSNSDDVEERYKKFLEHALAAAGRGAQLTRKLLSFSRQKETMPEQVNVNDVVKHMRDLLSKSLTASIQVELQLFPGLPEVTLSKGDLEDSILNLVLNARDAMQGEGQLTIATGLEVPGTDDQSYVFLSVRDTGCGMSEEIMAKVFEPFFSTKHEENGSGLGLSMVYGFVQRSGGLVDIRSELNKGTEIVLYLPFKDDGMS